MAQSKQDRVITAAQLGEHRTIQDLWVAVHGNVYDLTAFAADHPGGIDILVDCAGTDASEPYDYAGHGDDATATMQQFKIGKLAGYESLRKPESGEGAASRAQPSAGGSRGSWAAGSSLAQARVLLAAGVVAVIAAVTWLGTSCGPFSEKERVALQGTRSINSAQAFLAGVLVASAFGGAGLGYAYRGFRETLKHEREVFAYPAVIPKRKR